MTEEKVLDKDTASAKSGAVSEEDVNKTAMADVVPTLLQKGTDVSIYVAEKNILHKWNILESERKFTITPFRLGPLYEISHRLLSLETVGIDNLKDAKDEDVLQFGLKNIVANKDILVEVIGWGLLNTKAGPSKRLLRFINDNVTVDELLKLLVIIVSYVDVIRFLACTVSAKKTSLLGTEKSK